MVLVKLTIHFNQAIRPSVYIDELEMVVVVVMMMDMVMTVVVVLVVTVMMVLSPSPCSTDAIQRHVYLLVTEWRWWLW